jgi:hypothetical protein
MGLRSVERQHNKRLELTPRADYGMNSLSARRSSAASRYAARDILQNTL